MVMRRILYITTLVNICFELIYEIIGTTIDREMVTNEYIFSIFKPQYMHISGIIAFLTICVILKIMFKSSKRMWIPDIFVMLLNAQYIIFYQRFLMKL